MNEFDLQGWEREIQAWRRRLETEDAPLVRAELDDIADHIERLREHPESEGEMRQRVERRLVRLLALYDLARAASADGRLARVAQKVASPAPPR